MLRCTNRADGWSVSTTRHIPPTRLLNEATQTKVIAVGAVIIALFQVNSVKNPDTVSQWTILLPSANTETFRHVRETETSM